VLLEIHSALSIHALAKYSREFYNDSKFRRNNHGPIKESFPNVFLPGSKKKQFQCMVSQPGNSKNFNSDIA
jgi:hypothetical protein